MPWLTCGHGPVLAGLDLAGMVVTLDALYARRDAAASSPRPAATTWKPSPPHRRVSEPGGAFSCRFIGLVPAVSVRSGPRAGLALTLARRIGHTPALVEKRRRAGDVEPGSVTGGSPGGVSNAS